MFCSGTCSCSQQYSATRSCPLLRPRLAWPRPTRSPSHLIAGGSLSSVVLSFVVLACFFRVASILGGHLWGYCLHAFSGRVLVISIVGVYNNIQDSIVATDLLVEFHVRYFIGPGYTTDLSQTSIMMGVDLCHVPFTH